MSRAKLLAGFSAIIALLAFFAAPAFAEFQSGSSATKGATKGGAIVIEGGGATLECTSSEGTWTILSGEKAATKGETLSETIEKWNGCKAKSSLVTATPTVSSCTFQLKGAAGVEEPLGAISAECHIQIKVLGTCEINLTVAGNAGLQFASLQNNGTNMTALIAWINVSTSIKGTCLGIKATTAAKLKVLLTYIGISWA